MKNAKIQALELEIKHLEDTLNEKKQQLAALKKSTFTECPFSAELSTDEITRYSRQIIMPQLGLKCQILLKKSKILIVGAGGLGCPAALYLAAAGVGEIHIVDYDTVELTNLHRQILHHESDIGRSKVRSVCDKLLSLNPNISVIPLQIEATDSLVNQNKYDAILDCTDNPPTRYFLNDLAVASKTPLISASALQMEGQLTVYNYKEGPCYRCLFPKPPPAHTVTNCGDGGILGPVVGTMGCLQALECLKILTQADGVLSEKLLLFDGTAGVFRSVKLRRRMSNCEVCNGEWKLMKAGDYEQFCGSKANDKVVNIDILSKTEHVTASDLNENSFVLDVRPALEFEMCHLPNSFNLPFTDVISKMGLEKLLNLTRGVKKVFVICRRGNDSQRTIQFVNANWSSSNVEFFNVKGGLQAYSKHVDPSFPIY